MYNILFIPVIGAFNLFNPISNVHNRLLLVELERARHVLANEAVQAAIELGIWGYWRYLLLICSFISKQTKPVSCRILPFVPFTPRRAIRNRAENGKRENGEHWGCALIVEN